jgi:branched-chain amino acid transport system permease protein
LENLLQQLLNGITWGSIYALIALGYTMVYGVLKLINFAHGEVYMVGAMSGYYAAHALGVASSPSLGALLVVMVASMLVCGLLGALIERVAYRPLRNAGRLAPLITAIGVSLLLQNAGQIVFGADPKFFPPLLRSEELVRVGGIAISNIQVAVLATAVVLMAGLQYVVRRTRFGRAMRAVSYDAPAAAAASIEPSTNVPRITRPTGTPISAAAGAS